MSTMSWGERMALKYADEIAALRVGDKVHTRGQAKRPVWEITGFEPHSFRPDGMSVRLRSLKTGRTATRDVVDVARV